LTLLHCDAENLVPGILSTLKDADDQSVDGEQSKNSARSSSLRLLASLAFSAVLS